MARLLGKLGLPLATTAMLVGCAQPSPPLPPSLELPRPVKDLRAIRKGNTVHLWWTVPSKTTDGQTVRNLGATRVCRDLIPASQQQCTPVGEVPPPPPSAGAQAGAGIAPTSKYTDTLPLELEQRNPSGFVSYAVQAFNTHGRASTTSNRISVALAPTLPPVANFEGQITAQGVLLTWSCPNPLTAAQPSLRYLLRLYRGLNGDLKSTPITDLDGQGCTAGQASFLDRTFEWEKNYVYRATLVTVVGEPGKSEVEIEGDDTPEVPVASHDVFPPSVPSGVQAVFSGPGPQLFIDLTWTPVPEADLVGYNLYRHEPGTEPVKLNSDLVKSSAYRDATVQPGNSYVYSVSAVDVRGNESARSEEASEKVE